MNLTGIIAVVPSSKKYEEYYPGALLICLLTQKLAILAYGES